MQTAAGSEVRGQGRTVAELAAALERLGFSVQPPLHEETDRAALDFLARLLEGPAASKEHLARIREWLDARRDACNEDLSRILLGERYPSAAVEKSRPRIRQWVA